MSALHMYILYFWVLLHKVKMIFHFIYTPSAGLLPWQVVQEKNNHISTNRLSRGVTTNRCQKKSRNAFWLINMPVSRQLFKNLLLSDCIDVRCTCKLTNTMQIWNVQCNYCFMSAKADSTRKCRLAQEHLNTSALQGEAKLNYFPNFHIEEKPHRLDSYPCT
jgi:hypothetical protein